MIGALTHPAIACTRPKRRNSGLSLGDAFKLLERAAVAGERCPITSGPNRTPGLHHHHLLELERSGRIRCEISAGNWRQVFILMGPHAGACTAANPNDKTRPYRTADRQRVVIKHMTYGGESIADVIHRPGPSAESEREARMHGNALRSLTGAIMGDPPVGHSALDRRAR